MKLSNTELPSNKKFGFFFTIIFLIIAYFLYPGGSTFIIFIFLALLFLITTLVKADLLLPLNKLWMLFGLLLGKIINPIILSIIFFGLFTPYGIVMRMFGRDELRIKEIEDESHWIPRSQNLSQTNFNRQF